MGDEENQEKPDSAASDTTEPSIDKEVRLFIQQIEGLAASIPFVNVTLFALRAVAARNFNRFLQAHGELVKEENGVNTYSVPLEHTNEADKLKRHKENLHVGLPILNRQYIVSLVSQYDAFLGRLLRCLFYLQPGILNASEHDLSFAELVKLASIEKARDYIAEKEVEKVLRMSHAEQFSWLEGKFKISLTKDLKCWPQFIEITERRNLFVHCDGVVSRQYFSVCRDHSVTFESGAPKVGERLDAFNSYFEESYQCIFEIAMRLSQVLWRKILKDNLELADRNLIEVTFDLICVEQYELALRLLEFGTEVLKKHSSEANRKTLIINRAQAYKWIGDMERCKKLLDGEDWTASAISFQLAVSVLEDDFKRSARILRHIGADGDIKELDYKNWPVFKEFRKSSEFLAAYEEIFGKPFATTVTASSTEEQGMSADIGALRTATMARDIVSQVFDITPDAP